MLDKIYMSKNIYAEFSSLSKKDWLRLIKSNISSDDFENFSLGIHTEGVTVFPIYTEDDFSNTVNDQSGKNTAQAVKSWQYQEIVFFDDNTSEEEANTLILKALEGGVESLLLDISKLNRSFNMNLLLQGVYLDAVDISWKLNTENFPPDNKQLQKLRGTLHINPLEAYMSKGTDPQAGLDKIEHLLSKELADYRGLSVSGYAFANSGADIVKEVAFTCNLLVEYLDQLTKRGFSAELLFQNLEITLSTRTSFLADTAKFRACSILVETIKSSYLVSQNTLVPLRALSAVYNKADYDFNTNLLRNTTEAMSAILGGCTKLCLIPHNGFQSDNDFGKRIARNVSHLLRHESHLDLVNDPLKGAYALESLTASIAEEAWALFQKIEKQGGILAAFNSGQIQDMIGKSADEYLNKIRTLRKTSVGANRYVTKDAANSKGNGFTSINLNAHTLPLLSEVRGPALIEGIRKMVDQEVKSGKKRPIVGIMPLSEISTPATVSRRSAFVEDIMVSIGFEVKKMTGVFLLENPGEGAQQSEISALAIVGDDEEYKALQPSEFLPLRKNYNIPLMLAGYPENIAQQTNKFGLSALIYANMNVPAFAEQFLEEINFFDL